MNEQSFKLDPCPYCGADTSQEPRSKHPTKIVGWLQPDGTVKWTPFDEYMNMYVDFWSEPMTKRKVAKFFRVTTRTVDRWLRGDSKGPVEIRRAGKLLQWRAR